MKARKLFSLLFIAGGVIGVLIVRSFFLEPFQEMGWHMFWNGLTNGEPMDIGMVFKSTTFAKCLGGFIIGGLAAGYIGIKIQKNNAKKPIV